MSMRNRTPSRYYCELPMSDGVFLTVQAYNKREAKERFEQALDKAVAEIWKE